MKSFARLAIVSATLLACPAYASQASCTTFATDMTKHVVAIFHDTTQSEDQKRQSLSLAFQKAVDTNWIGKFVLRRYWKSASTAQQSQYLSSYRAYITHNYISKFNDEDAMSVDSIMIAAITPQNPGQYEAKTVIKRKNEEDIKVDYLLDDTGGNCRVHDITVEGISLLASQHSEFSTLAGKSGIEGVIAAMQKQVQN